MMKISLCMIVKNEEDVLARCLNCVKDIADEIIIVDTGSQDKTIEIAKQYTKNVFTFKWCDDFSAARNFAFSMATCAYLMWLDADDVILPDNRQRILELKKSDSGADIYMLPYETAFDENGNATFTYYRERIVRNCSQARWSGIVHEVITPFGEVKHENAAITHKKERPAEQGRNLRIYKNALARGAKLTPREMFYYARELYYNDLTEEAITAFSDFLKGENGWVENKIDACRLLAECYTRQDMRQKALEALFKSFEYDIPRAETCCGIADIYYKEEDYRSAAYWYQSAMLCDKNMESGAFIQKDCYGFIPCIQLCVCWYRLGNLEKSLVYNRMAAEYKPDAEAVKANEDFFRSLIE